MEPHQLARVDGWLRQSDPRLRTTSKGYQLHQSMTVLGAGGLAGRRGWNDADAFFRMLPDDHTDFIFSVVGGQWGFVGCTGVLLLYALLFVCGVEIASATSDAFGRMLAVGVLAMFFTQLVVNAGMTMGLMPITGMTLPLISYGGSSLLANCAALGLLVNVGQARPISLGRRPFEFGRRREKPPAPFGPLAEG
jgi:rod shape determining protein RodA